MHARNTRPAPTRAPIAPIHRGPQAQGPGTYGAPVPNASNAALLIDFDNVTMGIRSGFANELRSLLGSEIIKGKVAVKRAYADWRRYPQYIVPLAESSIDMIMAPAYGSSKKNATDIRLAVDAMELVFTRPEIGTYILLSGDSDFASLVTKIKEYGKYVIGIGIRESSSDLLVMNCDEYYSYNALAGLVKSSDEEVTKWDAWELVVEAITRMQKNGDVMRSDRLKQVMQDIDATFDEKNVGHGYSKFSRFVSDAADKGLLTTTKLENGQLEVTPGTGQAVVAAQASLAASPPSETEQRREERSGRRRRGGRGRGGRDGERTASPAAATPAAADSTTAKPAVAAATEQKAAPAAEQKTAAAAPAAAEQKAAPATASTTSARPAAAAPSTGATARAATPAAAAKPDTIGLSGERLSRAEAFDLVRKAVEATTKDVDDSALSYVVRHKAHELLGRDSESLSERNFHRILRDAHDVETIDLRRRGDDYEVSRPAKAPSVAEQVSKAEAAATPAPKVSAPGPRGMGPRGIPGRGRGRASEMPPELLMVGVVGPSSGAVAKAVPASDNGAEAEVAKADVAKADAAKAEAAPVKKKPTRTPRKRAAKKATAKATVAPDDAEVADKKPKAKTARKRAAKKKTAAV